MTDDDSDFFGITEEEQFRDWLDWGEQLVAVISLASQRLGLAIAAGGFAVAGANMIEKAPMLGQVSLGVAGVFGIWLAVASLRGVAARR
jgi:hypothetical protein